MRENYKEAFEKTKKAGEIAAGALDEVSKIIKPGIQTNTIEVTVEAVEVEIIADEEVINCENDIVNMSAYTNYPNATITWEVLEGQELINQELYSASSTGAGIYSVEVVSLDGNCSDEDTFEVIVDTTSYSANAGESFELNCLTTSYVLQGSSDGDDATFVWSTTDGQFFGSTFTPNPTVLSDGTYTLEVTNPNNECTSNSSVVITEDVAVPEIDLGYPSSDISCESPMIQIIGTTINPPGYTNIIEWGDPDRFIAGIELYKYGKAKKLIFTGGFNPYNSDLPPEGDIYLEEALQLGIPNKDLIATSPVLNTYQEAKAVKKLLLEKIPSKNKGIILVTSAFHMKRAKRIFENEGLIVQPFPVDFKSSKNFNSLFSNPLLWLPSSKSLNTTSFAIRELIGRIIYRIFI